MPPHSTRYLLRGYVAGLAAVASLALPAAAARADGGGAIGGVWTLTFTPDTVRNVGDHVGRSDDLTCTSCSSQYQFTTAGAGDGRTTTLVLHLGDAACTGPCDVPVDSTPEVGFTGTVHWDGTAYTFRGEGFFGSPGCGSGLPKGTDTGTFTVSGSGADARMSGQATVLLSWVARNDAAGTCTDITGYELYTGTFTGRRAGFVPGPSASPGVTLPGANVPASSRFVAPGTGALADHAAAARHSRPSLSTGVADARSLPWRPGALLVSALLALLLVALMPFPAALFNATLEKNYDEVRGWFRFLPRRAARDPAEVLPASAARRWRDFAAFTGATAVLDAFLDPHLRLDRASVVLVAGLALSIAAVSLLGAVPARAYVRRAYHESAHVRLYPLGLGIAAFCVVVSRLTSFEPGYLYGVVAGFAFSRELARAEKGRIAFLTSAFLLAVAVAAFAIRIPVHGATLRSGSVPLALADTVLAAVFAAGVEANVLGLLPLRFLAGEAVYAWRRAAWAAAFGLSVFAFVHALSAQAGEARTAASVAVAAALFVAFGTVSVAFWAWFRFRPENPTPASV